MTRDFLETVVSETRARVKALSRERSQADLAALAKRMPPVRSLRASLSAPGRRIIAEIKRASPSRGPLNATADAAGTAARYERGGAAAISVLTEPEHFKGSLSDLRAVAKGSKIPVLRKDFLVEPWQAWEARAAGADSALLIVAALPGEALAEMASALAEAGLEALVETHDGDELERALSAGFPVVGVNARNLRTLKVDRALVESLGPKIPRGVVGVAESGVQSREDLEALEASGYHAFLVGEALITAKDPVSLLGEWIGSIQ